MWAVATAANIAELKTAKANLEYAVSSYQRMKEAIKSVWPVLTYN